MEKDPIRLALLVGRRSDLLNDLNDACNECWAWLNFCGVMMVTGNAPVLATKLGSLFSPVRTMTATIAAEMGEVANGSTHYHVLFFIGMVLFLISLGVNIAASSMVFRAKKRAERILS